MKQREIILLVVFLILAAIPSVYFYSKYRALQKEIVTKEDVAALTVRVGKHILLPEGEEPTVMTVTDQEKLSGQPFFANAKNGDKVLVYKDAKKAFLYDPEADIVIEVGPIMTAAPSPATSSAGSR